MFWNWRAIISRIISRFAAGENTTSGPTDLANTDDVGIHIVQDSCTDTSDGFDIVFVHGLRGSRIATFTSGKCFWLRDLLAQDLDNVRILTWGYDADIAKAFSFSSQESISGHAKTLLDDLTRTRELVTRVTRPIIFVCHSLGGLIVKDALIEAAQNKCHQRDLKLATIYTETKGVFFLGTPHRGSDRESLGDLVAKAAVVGLRRPNTQLLQSLRTDSHVLEKQRDQFITVSKDFLVRCVREEMPMGIGMIVPGRSATYDGFNVRTGSIHANHVNMVKFRSKDDQGYVRTLGWIRDMMREQVPEAVSTPSPLHVSAASTSPGSLEQTLQGYTPTALPQALNARDGGRYNRTPLLVAIVNDVPRNVRLLLQAGADPKMPSEGSPQGPMPPVFIAASMGRVECLEILIEFARLDPNMKVAGHDETTLLQVATENGKVDVVRRLLELGADPRLCDRCGWSPLSVAKEKKNDEILKLLTDATARQGQRLLPSS